jgi:hypothetical protein
MAWVRSNKKGSGGGSIPKLAIHSGKINLSNGNIESDSDYYYSDLFDAPNGNLRFDLGESIGSTYVGVEMCAANGSHVDYWSASQRFRQVNHAQYYARAPKIRVSFKASNLQKVVIINEVTYDVYLGTNLIHKVEE